MTSFFVEYFNNLGTQYGTKAVKSNVKIFALGRESIPAFFREWHTPERIKHMIADGGQEVFYSEVQRFGCQEGRLFTAGRARNKLLFVRSTDNSLPSCPLDFRQPL